MRRTENQIRLAAHPDPGPARSAIYATGEMADRIRRHVWERTPLGPLDAWGDVLTWSVNLMLESGFPTSILWGQEFIQLYNDAYLPLTAEKHPSLLGSPAAEQWQEAWHIIGPQFASVLKNGATIHQENVLVPVHRDGALRDVFWTYSYSPIRHRNGKIAGVLVVCHDVTARLSVERERDELARSRQEILESIADGLAILDQDWRYTYVNDQGAKMVQMQPHEMVGKRIWDLFPQALETDFGKKYIRATETGQPLHFEAFYPEPLNAWIECRCFPSHLGLSVYFQDITERKQIEEALRTSESRFRKLFESDMIGICIPDRFGAFRESNDELLRMTGYTREDLEAGQVRWDTMTPRNIGRSISLISSKLPNEEAALRMKKSTSARMAAGFRFFAAMRCWRGRGMNTSDSSLTLPGRSKRRSHCGRVKGFTARSGSRFDTGSGPATPQGKTRLRATPFWIWLE